MAWDLVALAEDLATYACPPNNLRSKDMDRQEMLRQVLSRWNEEKNSDTLRLQWKSNGTDAGSLSLWKKMHVNDSVILIGFSLPP